MVEVLKNLKVYFHAGQQPAAGYGRIIAIHSIANQPFSQEEIALLGQRLECDLCFPAPDGYTALILCRNSNEPTPRAIRKVLGRLVLVRHYSGGIFNPYLPVRPYDAWFD